MTQNLRPRVLTALCLLLLMAVSYQPGLRSVGASAGKDEKTGAIAQAQVQTLSRADGGEWSGLIPTTDVPVHLSLLPDGRLLYWGRDKADIVNNSNPSSHIPDSNPDWDETGKSKTFLSDPLYPETDYTTVKLNTTTNLFCSGHSFLPDGRLLVSGGHQREDQYPEIEGLGEKHLNVFDYRNNTTSPWTRSPTDMNEGRWYPFHVTLANGESISIGGKYWNGISYSAGLPLRKSNTEPTVRDLAGGVRTLSDNSSTSTFPNTGEYPYVMLAASGKVFIATPTPVPSNDPPANSRLLDPYATNNSGGKGVFTPVSKPSSLHYEGSAVMYAPNKVLMLGGVDVVAGDNVNKSAETIDLSAATPAWQSVGSMAWARHYPTATLLPDGKVLVTGGTSCMGGNNVACGGAVQTPEMWDPANPGTPTGPYAWTQMNPTTSGVPRVYHSVALLMPDARVLVGGGGLPLAQGETGVNGLPCPQLNENFPCRVGGHKNIEFFSPPYLFKADGSPAIRPSITAAPESINYGQTFNVGVGNSDASNIGSVVLIRLPSVTHTFNQDQRRVVLTSTVSGSSLNVAAPANGNACPPGPYMLFLISNDGRNTPSVAKIVRVGSLALDQTSQSFPMNTDGGTLSGVVNIAASPGTSWTAQRDPSASWITITSGASGTGNGTVRFTVAPNTNPPPGTPAGTPPARRKGQILIQISNQEPSPQVVTVYQSVNFADVVSNSTEFPTAISKIFAREITGGCTTSPLQYCPSNPVTREQMATFLARVVRGTSQDPPQPLVQTFFDVPLTSSSAKYIDYVARRRITVGCDDQGNFCPTRPVTRAQMAIFLCRALGINDPPAATGQFLDVPADSVAARYIEEIARRGITRGCARGSNYFCPEDSVSRDQMAVFLVRAFGL